MVIHFGHGPAGKCTGCKFATEEKVVEALGSREGSPDLFDGLWDAATSDQFAVGVRASDPGAISRQALGASACSC